MAHMDLITDGIQYHEGLLVLYEYKSVEYYTNWGLHTFEEKLSSAPINTFAKWGKTVPGKYNPQIVLIKEYLINVESI